MSLILSRKGYNVATTKSGMEAIKRIKEEPFDMVFMDIKMPLMNGVEAFKKIKKISPNTFVMMMTAYAVEDFVQEALEEGAKGIMYKPLDIDNLLSIVKKVMVS